MNETYLAHHGIKGQKWGIRKYQNADGTLTAKGLKRYTRGDNGARRYLADRAIAETRRDKSKQAKVLRAEREGLGVLTGATTAITGYAIGKQKGGKVGGYIGALAGYAAGHLSIELSAKAGEWLGSRIGASMVNQRYVDVVNRQIQNGKVGSLSQIRREGDRGSGYAATQREIERSRRARERVGAEPMY